MTLCGIVNLDKPAGLSSARAVGIVKRLLPKGTKIGHAGTLDPFATGVLLLLVGKATKSCEKLMDAPKQYEAIVRLGATTATDDPESAAEPWVRRTTGPADPPTRERVASAVATFRGEILQRPPPFSALKVGGRRAYDLARSGRPVLLQPRPVRIYACELTAYEWPLASLRVDCGRGTYIRSIARDLGELLDVGGHLAALRRTAIGNFTAHDAATLEHIQAEGVSRFLHLLPENLPPSATPVWACDPVPQPESSRLF